MTAFNIREATPNDKFELLAITRKFYKEGKYEFMKFDNEHLANQVDFHLRNPDTLVLVAEVDGEIVGFFAAILAPHFFALQPVANELAWFVVKEHRKSKIGVAMIDKYLEWAEEHKVPFANMSLIVDSSPELKEFYNSKGFYEKETTFIKRFD